MDIMSEERSSLPPALDLHRLAGEAYARLQAGDLQGASTLLQQRLALIPDDPYARQMLAVVAGEQGRLGDAATVLWQLADEGLNRPGVVPNLVAACARLGSACQKRQIGPVAQSCFLAWALLEPEHATPWWGLATLAQREGRNHDAVAFYGRVLTLRPEHEDALWNLGLLCYQTNRLPLALWCFEQGVLLNPGDALLLLNYAALLLQHGSLERAEAVLAMALPLGSERTSILCTQGEVYHRRGNSQAAIQAYYQALAEDPQHSLSLRRLGSLLFQEKYPKEAGDAFLHLVLLDPGSPDSLSNLAIALRHQEHYEQALDLYRWGLQISPENPAFYYNQGIAQANSGAITAAEASFRAVLRLMPGHEGAHHLLGQMRLLQGDLEEGGAMYEWRSNNLNFKTTAEALYGVPVWEGCVLPPPETGGTLSSSDRVLIMGEGGIGDILQFMRYGPAIAATGAEVVLHYRRDLEHLLRTLPDPDGRIVHNPAALNGRHGAVVMGLSLPYRCGTTLATIPARVPYLQADPQRIARWQPALAGLRGLKVGLAWETRNDYQRSIAIGTLLTALEPVPGLALVSLQKGPGAEDLNALPEAVKGRVLQLPIDEDSAVFADTAAVMAQLDLVISIDTAAAHLAGALGCKTWVLLYAVPDWRWLLERDDSPWYPTMRLFRQTRRGDWGPVLERLVAALQAEVESPLPE